MKDLGRYLLEAAGKKKEKISLENPYREIGFDGDKARLGWVKPIDFNQIKTCFESISYLLEDKKKFIFIGMGGSVNGIKPLLAVFDSKKIFTLDSLDPKATNNILNQIDNPKDTLVVAVSKSGSTKETQLLAQTLRAYFSTELEHDQWTENFLWLTDPESFSKLDSFGWEKVKKIPIQPNQCSDIGGRFSSPHTNIFILPLFLLLDKDFERLREFYLKFVEVQPQIRQNALGAVSNLREKTSSCFGPMIRQKWSKSLASWLVQLFQESLGGKGWDKSVKTIVNFSDSNFINIEADILLKDSVPLVMAQMYYYQLFVAYLAGLWNINFVNQAFVEEYKKEMLLLEKQEVKTADIPSGGLEFLLDCLDKKINESRRFIEVVLYFWPDPELISLFRHKFSERFSQKVTLIFIGSDWNHQSYQAAFDDRDTFYVLVCLADYIYSGNALEDKFQNNVEVLRKIALATYQTLSDKSVLYNLR